MLDPAQRALLDAYRGSGAQARDLLARQALQRRTVGRLGVIVLTLLIAGAPYVLFFDPIDSWPGQPTCLARSRRRHLLFSDDVPYISASRTWARTVSNLFEPHNTHIVPAWRILTWALVRAAGDLERPSRSSFGDVVFGLVLSVLLAGGAATTEQ